MIRYIKHITLDTGDVRRSPLHEVSNDTIKTLAPHLQQAVIHGIAKIPSFDNYSLQAERHGAFLLAKVIRNPDHPVITFGVAPHSRCAGRLWEALLKNNIKLTDANKYPKAPWCAVRLDSPSEVMSAAEWLADYERCVAWTWIKIRKQDWKNGLEK